VNATAANVEQVGCVNVERVFCVLRVVALERRSTL
jgi:hypothetical protein